MARIDSRILLSTILICAGGSFHFGYRLISFNPTENIMRRLLEKTSLNHYCVQLNDQAYRLVWSFTVNLLPIGNIVGTLFTPLVSHRIGRKRSMYITSIISVIGSALSGLASVAESFELYAAGVFVTGIACGLILGIQPLYLVEISPTEVRGQVNSFTAISVEGGFFIGSLFGLPELFGTEQLWQWIFYIEIVPSLVLVCVLPFLPESPKFLVAIAKDQAAARKALLFFRHTNIDKVINEIMAEIEVESKPVRLKELFVKAYLRRGFMFGLLAAIGISFCGITAISSFSTVVLKEAGLSEHNAQYATLGISINSALASCISSLIADRLGRRPLLVIGYILLTTFNTLFMVFSFVSSSYDAAWAGYLCVAIDVMFTFVFGIGPAPLQWYVMGEMVPQNARSLAQTWAVTSSAIGLIIVNLLFLPLNGVIYEFAYLVFIIPTFSLAIYFYMKFPETKNKTIVEIMEILGVQLPDKPDNERPNLRVTVASDTV